MRRFAIRLFATARDTSLSFGQRYAAIVERDHAIARAEEFERLAAGYTPRLTFRNGDDYPIQMKHLRELCVGEPRRMTPEEFQSMKSGAGLAYEDYRDLVVTEHGARWYVINRQYSCGMCIHYAHKIVIVMKAAA